MAGASGKQLDETYKLAWIRGLKTTYYLRSMGATHAEKSTSKAGALNAVPSSGGQFANSADTTLDSAAEEPKFCSIDNPECEACQ
jgi:ribonucleoside-diphosphate reductase alpha chain